jgi:poly-gamma-glutamate synthesis protein (capsule biosynthesis protein)
MGALEGSLSLARGVDISILSCHWGPNWRTEPYSMFERFAKEALGCGVDILHGHSAHIFQGIQLMGGKSVLYDTGDFIEDYPATPLHNDWSFISLLDVDIPSRKTKKLTLVPTILKNCQVNLAPEPLASEICARMSKLCGKLGTKTKREGRTLIIEPA